MKSKYVHSVRIENGEPKLIPPDPFLMPDKKDDSHIIFFGDDGCESVWNGNLYAWVTFYAGSVYDPGVSWYSRVFEVQFQRKFEAMYIEPADAGISNPMMLPVEDSPILDVLLPPEKYRTVGAAHVIDTRTVVPLPGGYRYALVQQRGQQFLVVWDAEDNDGSGFLLASWEVSDGSQVYIDGDDVSFYGLDVCHVFSPMPSTELVFNPDSKPFEVFLAKHRDGFPREERLPLSVGGEGRVNAVAEEEASEYHRLLTSVRNAASDLRTPDRIRVWRKLFEQNEVDKSLKLPGVGFVLPKWYADEIIFGVELQPFYDKCYTEFTAPRAQ